MQKIISSLIILVLCLASVPAALGARLIFKTTKEIKNPNEKEYVEIARFSTDGFKQLRIGVILVSGEKRTLSNLISLHAVEGEDLIFLKGFTVSADLPNNSAELENLPEKIRISVRESGTYKVFIWGS